MARGDETTTTLLHSVPSSETSSTVFTTFTGGNFAELFHGEFSSDTEARPILDEIAPNCPTNLTAHINTSEKKIMLMWYFPSSITTDGSYQNDIREFYVFMLKEGFYQKIASTKIPRFVYSVPDEQLTEAFDSGINFYLKAVDYHDLESNESQVIKVFLNKDFSCKGKEKTPVYLTNKCGLIDDSKKLELKKKMIFKGKNTFTFNIGTHVGLKEPFKNKSNALFLKIKDLVTGQINTFEIIVDHRNVISSIRTFGTVPKTSDIIEEIRMGGTRFTF